MKPELERSSRVLKDRTDEWIFVPTAELASVGRAARYLVVLGNALALWAMYAVGVEIVDQPLQASRVVGEVPVELVEGVAALGGDASLRIISVAYILNILLTSTCVKDYNHLYVFIDLYILSALRSSLPPGLDYPAHLGGRVTLVNSGTRDQHLCASLYHEWSRLDRDASIDLYRQVTHLPEPTYFPDHLRDKSLSTETRIYAHHQHEIQVGQSPFDKLRRGSRVERNPGLGVAVPNHGEGSV